MELVRAPTWIVLGVPFLALTLLGVVELGGLNTSLFYSFNRLSIHTGTVLWAHLTILGDGLVCAVFLLPWIRRRPDRVWGGILGALVMFVILRIFKGTLNLPRPLGVLPEESVIVIGPGHRRSAFPSGHTATVFLFFGIWALSERQRLRSLLLILPPILLGISRMVVGVHWPADILAGAALGWTSAWVGLRWAGRVPWGMGRRGSLTLGALLLISAGVMLVIDHTGYPGVIWFQRLLAGGLLGWGGWEFAWMLRGPKSAGFPDPESGDLGLHPPSASS
jgi:membrane-associated phospholipid phosphatase